MASEVDIANLALAHLGDTATVSSLNPPEGSAQAEHCARFYPIVRDSLLERYQWSFATKRILLAQVALDAANTQWKYSYAAPSDLLNVISILASDSTNDNNASGTVSSSYDWANSLDKGTLGYAPQQFSCEVNASGVNVIYTNQENAMLRYTALTSDASKFSPLFVDCLGWLLAAYLAGPLIKGDVGAAMGKECMGAFQRLYALATVSDGNQRKVNPEHEVGWINSR